MVRPIGKNISARIQNWDSGTCYQMCVNIVGFLGGPVHRHKLAEKRNWRPIRLPAGSERGTLDIDDYGDDQ